MKLGDTVKEGIAGKILTLSTVSCITSKNHDYFKSHYMKEVPDIQGCSFCPSVGYGTAWKTTSQLFSSGKTLTHSFWMMIHLGWRARHTAAWVGGGLTPRAMILFQRGSRRRTLWDPLLTQNETQNNSHMQWNHPDGFGNRLGNIHLSLILKVYTAHYMDLNTLNFLRK